MKTTLQVLQEARDKIEQGWTQGSLKRTTGFWLWEKASYCAVGAIDASAIGDEHLRDPALSFLRRVIVNREDDGPWPNAGSVMLFNDTHTKAEVLDLFDRAIAKLSQRPTQALGADLVKNLETARIRATRRVEELV